METIQNKISHFNNYFQRKQAEFVNIITTVIIIGLTGSGKSTLANYLSNKPVTVTSTPMGWVLTAPERVDDQDNELIIGHNIGSMTTEPHCWFDQTTGTLYWDCPGFEDTNGFPQDVINAFYIHKLFTDSTNIKVLLVMSEISLYREAGLRKVFDGLGCMFLGREQDLINSISFVLTRQRDFINEGAVVRRILEMPTSSPLLVQMVGENSEKLSLFPHPCGFPGPINDGDLVPGIYMESIKSKIAASTTLLNPNPNISISAEAKLRVVDLADLVSTAIGESIRSLATLTKNYCDNLVTARTLSLDNLKAKFTSMSQGLTQIQDMISYDDIVQYIEEFNGRHGISLDLTQLKGFGNEVRFLMSIDKTLFSQDKMQQWKRIMYEDAGGRIRTLANPPVSIINKVETVERYTRVVHRWRVWCVTHYRWREHHSDGIVRAAFTQTIQNFQLTNGITFSWDGEWSEIPGTRHEVETYRGEH